MRRKVSTLQPTSVYRKANKMICKEEKKKKLPPVVCQPLQTHKELNLCDNFISKEPDYIDCFSINFPQHCVFGHIILDSNPLDNMDSWKKVVQPSRKSRSVGPSKSKPKKTTRNPRV